VRLDSFHAGSHLAGNRPVGSLHDQKVGHTKFRWRQLRQNAPSNRCEAMFLAKRQHGSPRGLFPGNLSRHYFEQLLIKREHFFTSAVAKFQYSSFTTLKHGTALTSQIDTAFVVTLLFTPFREFLVS
jgi:hypothetical protein